jgi:predicted metal-binding protein
MSSQQKPVREISAKWDDVLLVCRKCSRKVHGGFGRKGGQRLEKALKSELKGRGRYKVVSVPCLDICPKNAVCLVRAGEPGKVRLVAPGADMEDIVGGFAPPPSETR